MRNIRRRHPASRRNPSAGQQPGWQPCLAGIPSPMRTLLIRPAFASAAALRGLLELCQRQFVRSSATSHLLIRRYPVARPTSTGSTGRRSGTAPLHRSDPRSTPWHRLVGRPRRTVEPIRSIPPAGAVLTSTNGRSPNPRGRIHLGDGIDLGGVRPVDAGATSSSTSEILGCPHHRHGDSRAHFESGVQTRKILFVHVDPGVADRRRPDRSAIWANRCALTPRQRTYRRVALTVER